MSPTQQKALLLKSRGAPFEVGPFPVPSPGPGQVLVKILSTALNPVDPHMQLGFLVDSYPAVAGSDGAGLIESIGDGVHNVQKGDKVYVISVNCNRRRSYIFKSIPIQVHVYEGNIPAICTR
jgi:NADPH:quinone reductase-like Zn-dependent oxidoreductase